jgi:hypothetical protein
LTELRNTVKLAGCDTSWWDREIEGKKDIAFFALKTAGCPLRKPSAAALYSAALREKGCLSPQEAQSSPIEDPFGSMLCAYMIMSPNSNFQQMSKKWEGPKGREKKGAKKLTAT